MPAATTDRQRVIVRACAHEPLNKGYSLKSQNLLSFINGVKVPETGDEKKVFKEVILEDRRTVISHTITTTPICEE